MRNALELNLFVQGLRLRSYSKSRVLRHLQSRGEQTLGGLEGDRTGSSRQHALEGRADDRRQPDSSAALVAAQEQVVAAVEAQRKAEEEVSRLRKDLEEAATASNKYRDELEAIRQERTSLISDVNTLKGLVSSRDTAISGLKQTAETLRIENGLLTQRNAVLTTEVTRLENDSVGVATQNDGRRSVPFLGCFVPFFFRY